MSKLDYDRVALILVESAFFGDPQTSKRWGVAVRTIRNYRARLEIDSELASFFLLKKQAFESEWASEIPSAIRAGIRFLGEAAQVADRTNPEAIHAIAGAVKILAEVGLTKEILDVKLGRFDRTDREEGRQMVAISSESSVLS